MLSLLILFGCKSPVSTIKRPPIATVQRHDGPSVYVKYMVTRGFLHAEEENWPACSAAFKSASQNRPRDPWIHVHWGNSAWTLGRKDDAVAQWEKAIAKFGVHKKETRATLRQKIDAATAKP